MKDQKSEQKNSQNKSQTFNNVGQFNIKSTDLPLSCPLPNASLWDAHPRVYLPIEETGKATCPYCSAQYVLTDFQKDKHR